MLTYKIHLIRSGASTESDDIPVLGGQDLDLSQDGAELLNELDKNFEYPYVDVVYTSPLKAAIQTADILYPEKEPIIMQELLDMNLGEFSGKTYDELKDNEDFQDWVKDSVSNTPPYGENIQDFTNRIVSAINAIFMQMNKDRKQDVAVIAESGFIMTLLSAIGIPRMPMDRWQSENGTGFTIMLTTQMWMRDGAFEIIGNVPALDEN